MPSHGDVGRRHRPHPEPLTIGAPAQPGWVAKLFGAKPKPPLLLPAPDPLYRLERIGLRDWQDGRPGPG